MKAKAINYDKYEHDEDPDPAWPDLPYLDDLQTGRLVTLIDWLRSDDSNTFDLSLTWQTNDDGSLTACAIGHCPLIFPEEVTWGRKENAHRFRLKRQHRTADYQQVAQYLFGLPPEVSELVFRPYEGIRAPGGDEPDSINGIKRPLPNCSVRDYCDFLDEFVNLLP